MVGIVVIATASAAAAAAKRREWEKDDNDKRTSLAYSLSPKMRWDEMRWDWIHLKSIGSYSERK